MPDPSDAEPATVALAVVGAHLRGQPLNHQLTDRGAEVERTTRTAPRYRLHALPTDPPKPGLVRVADGETGHAVEVEVWRLEVAAFGSFVAQVPAPLCIGRVVLEDGAEVCGFLCEAYAVEGAPDISAYGGWRSFIGSGPSPGGPAPGRPRSDPAG